MSALNYIIQQCCARIHIVDNLGNKFNQGSGVIISDNAQHFVITADHCVYGDKNQYKDITADEIWVDVQDNYDSEFRRIAVVGIVSNHKDHDWVMLQIEDPQINCDFPKIFKALNFVTDEEVKFCGYQSLNVKQYRPWTASILTIAPTQFRIKIINDTFQQGGESGSWLAKGLSGSGVFISKNDKLYLIGILKSVVGDVALNNDIDCCLLSNLKGKLTDKFLDLTDVNFIEDYVREIENNQAENDIENWALANVEYFDNLNRKASVLYPAEKAKQISSERIVEFLWRSATLEILRKDNSEILLQYERTAKLFEKRVRETYTQEISDRQQAKGQLQKLEQDFAESIKSIFNDKSNYLNIDLARHKVTEWLMNCSFDFKEE
jgi:hypothetical protein